MKNRRYLPLIKDRNQYSELFQQDSHWELAIRHLGELHGLIGDPVRGVRGSHIVYRIGSVWIKLMAPFFSADLAYELAGLKTVQTKLCVQTPEIRGVGEIEGWKYAILSHVEGERIGDLYFQLSAAQQGAIAAQIGTITKEIHQAQADSVVKGRGEWNAFIQERWKNCYVYHQNKKLDFQWLNNLENFMGQFSVEEFLMESSVFLHADLTFDHFLLKKVEGKYQVSGVIDFADCRMGHPEYDMVASTAFLFKGRKDLLQAYLQKMGLAENGNSRFSEKLLLWTALHLFSDFKNYFSEEMNQVEPGDFSALAKLVYPI